MVCFVSDWVGTVYDADVDSFIGLDIDWEYPKGEFLRTYARKNEAHFISR
jgi:GH18 family chitinase